MCIFSVPKFVYFISAMKRSLGGSFLLFILISNAWAVSAPSGPGCIATNGGAINLGCPAGLSCSRGASFQAGEIVNFSVDVPDGPYTLRVSGGQTIRTNATSSFTASYVIPSTGNYSFIYDNSASPSTSRATATCTAANFGNDDDITKHQVSNHLSAIMGIYGEHRSPILYHQRAKDDVFQDGSGTAPSITGTTSSLTVNGSLRGLGTYINNNSINSVAATAQPQKWDLWMKGRYSDFENGGSSSDGYAAVLNLGVDYEVSKNILVGVMAGYDWGTQSSSTLNTSTDISGFVIGPYASVRLTDELSLYGRAVWGQADYTFEQAAINGKISQAAIMGKTSSDRFMLNASLKGTYWTNFPIRLTPDISLQYIVEDLDGHTDSNNNSVAGTKVELGQLRFGGEIGKRVTLKNGLLFDPFVSIHAVWNFKDEGTLNFGSNLTTDNSDLRAQVGLGFSLQTSENSHLNLAIQYEGLGTSDFSALSGTARFVIPLD